MVDVITNGVKWEGNWVNWKWVWPARIHQPGLFVVSVPRHRYNLKRFKILFLLVSKNVIA